MRRLVGGEDEEGASVSSLVCRGPWARQGLLSREELGKGIPVFIFLSIPP